MQSAGDCLQYPVDVLHHVVVPEAQDAIVAFAKPLIANRVAFARRVPPAIDFNDQASLATDKVDDIGTYGFLPNEFHSAERPRADAIPQPLFRNGGRATKAPRGIRFSGSCSAHEVHPHARFAPTPSIDHSDSRKGPLTRRASARRPLPARGER
jgi:hypothetical protein